MTLLQIKQEAAQLTERERRQLSAFLIRLGQQTPTWRREMSRRMRAMDRGCKVSLDQLMQRVANG